MLGVFFPILSAIITFSVVDSRGMYVYVSPPESKSGLENDACGVYALDYPANVNETDSRDVVFKSAKFLPTDFPTKKADFNEVILTDDQRVGCVDKNGTPYIVPDVKDKVLVQRTKCYKVVNRDDKEVSCPVCCEFPTKASVLTPHGAKGLYQVVLDAIAVDKLPTREEICQGYYETKLVISLNLYIEFLTKGPYNSYILSGKHC